MSKQTEALKLALDECVLAKIQGRKTDRDEMLDAAITHIRETLALVNKIDQEQPAPAAEPRKPQQEPVAWRFPKAGTSKGDNNYYYTESLRGEEDRFLKCWQPLYTSPPVQKECDKCSHKNA